MGSRAIIIVCRDAGGGAASDSGFSKRRTGSATRAPDGDSSKMRRSSASCWRPFAGALDRSGFWERFNTDWVCLDCELMPWSAKALELVRQQYASVGTAARVGLGETVRALETAGARGIDVGALLERHRVRLDLAERFARAYRNYCWPVESLRDIRIAPFHVMATEGAVHADKDHVWHMNTIGSFVQEGDGLLMRRLIRSWTLPIRPAKLRRPPGGRPDGDRRRGRSSSSRCSSSRRAPAACCSPR